MFRRFTFQFALFVLTFSVFLLTSGNVGYAIPFQVDGENGADGATGDPGANGEDGTDGSNTIEEAPLDEAFFSVFGTSGGNGGDGGDGIDGDDEDGVASGGNGGNGGDGGSVRIEHDEPRVSSGLFKTQATTATGGNGGNGGRGGFGSARELHGAGGNGGDGGRAVIDGVVVGSSRLRAYGGRGGSGYGTGSSAGNGGRAKVSARLFDEVEGDHFYYATVGQHGGRGGKGFDGANGGNGAASTFGYDSNQLTVDSSDREVFKTVQLELSGGPGGDSENGDGGLGGTARLNMAPVVEGASRTTNGLRVIASVQGGHGGRGIASGNQDADGANGAIALLNTGDTVWHAYSFNYLSLLGGGGGSALGRLNTGDGGHGATAVVQGDVHLVGSSGNTNLRVRMQGGQGGHAQGTGWAGHGGSVSTPNVDLESSSRANLTLNAYAGDGGWGKRNGSGGHATIVQFSDQQELGDEEALLKGIYNATARGGNAGQGKNSVVAALGGNAMSDLSQIRSSALDVTSTARAGFGNQGASGTATAKSFAHSLYDERFGDSTGAVSRAFATTNNSIGGNWRPSIGTSSDAYATAINENDGVTQAFATAVSGWGFLEAGNAKASSYAENTRDGLLVQSSSYSRGPGSQNAKIGNVSESSSVSIGKDGSLSQSFATSERVGHNATAQSTASATGSRVRSISNSSTSTSSWKHNAAINVTSTTRDSIAENIVTADTGSLIQFRSTDTVSRPVLEGQMTASLLVNPLQDQVADFINNESGLGDKFLSNDADILGVGSIIAAGVDGVTLFSNGELELDLEVQEYQSGGRFQIGLFNLGENLGGFEDFQFTASVDDREVLNTRWLGDSGVDDAQAFFDNLVIDVGETPANRESISLEFRFGIVTNDAMDGFELGYVFGNVGRPMDDPGDEEVTLAAFEFASSSGSGLSSPIFSAVPEPSSAVVIVGLGLARIIQRRRS